MAKYLVFMDVDGTLLIDHTYISNRTKKTIEKLQQQDVLFYIATGRMYELARIAQQMINSDVHLITANGAVFDGINGREITKLGAETVELTYRITQENHTPMILYTPETAYYTQQIPPFIAQTVGNFDSTKLGYQEIKNWSELKSIENDIINGVVVKKDEMSNLASVHEKLKSCQLMLLSSSSPDNLELIPLQTDKGTAIQKIQAEQQIDTKHTFVFGDGLNDLGMIEQADLSVAMGNALPAVKKAANYITGTNDNDGLADFLEQYFNKHPLV